MATNDDAAAVNEVVREQLVTAGAVDDVHVAHGSDGLRIGVGDQVMTRQNQPDLGVANRMTWTVTGIADHSEVQLYNETRRQHTTVNPDYVRHHLHLAYAATVHGVQGDTADHGDLVLSDATDAAAVYVGLTRGRYSNAVHIVTGTLDQAREQWVQAAGRNRADLGLDQARAAATAEARNYAPTTEGDIPTQRPAVGRDRRVSFAERMERVNARLARTATPVAATESTAAAADEYQAEHESGHQHRQTGPRL